MTAASKQLALIESSNYNRNRIGFDDYSRGDWVMVWLAFGLTICFACMALYQVIFAIWFCGLLLNSNHRKLPDQGWPKVAILMSLRGADPQLGISLQRMLDQDYPEFKLHVIVDSSSDPAYPIVSHAAEQHVGKLDLAVLTERRKTCGLQCSAFVQAYHRIDDDSEIIVTVDGDLMPHANWLKELVAPLLQAGIGASFGNRWFAPTVPTFGGLVRYLWNAAAVVPMALLSIPWGGCFAMRRSAFDQANLVDKWSRAIVHDAPVMSCLQELKLRIKFVPSLMMPIREQCSLKFCLDFIKRQMTWTRIYHAGWGAILFHGFATSMLWMMAIVLVLVGAAQGESRTWQLAGGGLFAYVVVMMVMLSAIEYSVRTTLRRRGEPTRWGSWSTWLQMPLAIGLAQFTHFIGVLLANGVRQVTWRGVTYALRGPWDIELQSDRPFEPASNQASL